MGQKEKLILFLINKEPGIKSVYDLVRHFDRAKFPGEIGKCIDLLASQNLIRVTRYFDNGTAAEYAVTLEGKEFLSREFNKAEILRYVETFDNPELIIAYITKNS